MNRKVLQIIVLLSGAGSNFISLHNKAKGYEITALFSDNPLSPALSFAKAHAIPTTVISPSAFVDKGSFKAAFFDELCRRDADLLVLAGFMQIVPKNVVELWSGKIINIHPSLLPKYPGLNTHQRALAAGETEHGCTVHFVDAGVDTGPTIAQALCPCYASDSVEKLQARVQAREHELYPWVVRSIAENAIRLEDGKVIITEGARGEALTLGFRLPS